MNKLFTIGIFVTGLLGAGCNFPSKSGLQEATGNQQPIQGLQDVAPVQPAKLPNNFDRRSVSFRDGRTVDLIVVKISKENWKWSMHNNPQSPKKVSAWRQEIKSNLVINGSYFTETNQPSGYYKIGTKPREVALADFSQASNGYTGVVGLRDGSLEIIYLPYLMAESRIIEKYDSVFLTYPTLLVNGKNLVKEDSGKFSSRTILAQDASHESFIIFTERGNISLFEIAQWLENQPEKFQTALNLDGGPSSGISYSVNDETYELSSSSVPNVLSAKIITNIQ